MIKLNGQPINVTTFPDKTSQVWRLTNIDELDGNRITWEFEHDGEVFLLCQLLDLLYAETKVPILLDIPTLPYARQDKITSNESTFALNTFLNILDTFYNDRLKVTVLDAHNPKVLPYYFTNKLPTFRIISVISEVTPDIICFPDQGASKRGYTTEGLPVIILDKKRNQSTGEIEGLEYNGTLDLECKSVLILDDLCDGGRTFIEAAKLLYGLGVKSVDLYTTHGIYSKGVDCLKEAGIKRIFNFKGEL